MDREKVLTWLEICGKNRDCSATCPYGDGSLKFEYTKCIEDLMADALALLKEQEAVEPYQHDAVWLCGNCDKEVVGWTDDITGEDISYPFCRQCGRPVKWK